MAEHMFLNLETVPLVYVLLDPTFFALLLSYILFNLLCAVLILKPRIKEVTNPAKKYLPRNGALNASNSHRSI